MQTLKLLYWPYNMTAPRWITAKDLGVIEESTYFELSLTATSDGGDVTYMILSGNLPNGIALSDSGTLYGVPIIGTPSTDFASTFTVRARNSDGFITDRTFNILISGVAPPVIATTALQIGTYYDGDYLEYQLESYDDDARTPLSWSLVHGRLPAGVTLSSSGLLQGFLTQNITAQQVPSELGWDRSNWDSYQYDFVEQQNSSFYEFTVELTDGVNASRKTFVINVFARATLLGDTTTIDTDTNQLTVDETTAHLPFITTPPQTLYNIKPGMSRQDTYFAFKFDGVDFDNEEFVYEISSPDQRGFDQDGDIDGHTYGVGFDVDVFDGSVYPMPLYLGLDNATGWYTGHINHQVIHQETYTIQVYARKSRSLALRGYRNTYQVTILGQIGEYITWVTNSNLGSFQGGDVCGITLQAVSSTNSDLIYHLKSTVKSRTPQGVVLLPNGHLTGRVTFEFFKFDQAHTTIDGNTTTFDKVCQFTVVARTATNSAYSEQTFTITLDTANRKPYETLYLKSFPSIAKRQLFDSIMTNHELFPPELIYKADDPWYGTAQSLKFLFLSGINPSLLVDYAMAMANNHYTKTLLFGNIKTAAALDNNYNILYEVVYLDIVDRLEGKDPTTGLPAYGAQSYDLSDRKHAYQDNGTSYTTLTPNGLGNMSRQLIDTVGLANNDALPQWMVSEQPDLENPGQFLPPLGYVPAVVLAYTVPGASNLIAYRLKQSNINFNSIPFTTDRYQLDNYLTNNFDIELLDYKPGVECTIDQAPSVAELFKHVGTVDYAVTLPFERINSRYVDYINYAGGLDGVTDFADGDTLIFAQQENYPNAPINQFVNYDVFGNRGGPSQDLRSWPRTYKNIPDPYVPYDSTRYVDDFDNDYFDHGRVGHLRWFANDGQDLSGYKWVYKTDGWLHDIPFDSTNYGNLTWSGSNTVPGYKEHILNRAVNERAGVYRVNIDGSGVVTLTLIQRIVAGDIVAVKHGNMYGGEQLYFEAYPAYGTAPRWQVLTQQLINAPDGVHQLEQPHQETTFDQRGTRFFSNRDQYSGPEINDKYLVFPKIGEFV